MAWPKRGFTGAVGFATETTWGTAVSITHWFPLISENVKRQREKVDRNVLYEASGSTLSRNVVPLHDRAGGPIRLAVTMEGLGLLLYHLMWGTPTTTGPASGIYTHTYVGGTAPPTGGLTCEIVKGTGGGEVFEGGRIRKATLEIDSESPYMILELDMIFQTSGGRTTASTPTMAASRDTLVRPPHGASASWNSASFPYKKASITIDRQLAERWLVGDLTTKDPAPSAPSKAECTLEPEYENETLWTGHLADTESDLVLAFTDSSSRVLTITLHNAPVLEMEDPMSGVGIIMQRAKFKGQPDATDYGVGIVIANTQSAATTA